MILEELGEPLNVRAFSPFPPRSADTYRHPLSPPWRRFFPCPTENQSNIGYHIGAELGVSPRRWWLCALCERNRIVSCPKSIWSHVARISLQYQPSGKECFGAHLGAPANGQPEETVRVR